MSTVVIIRRRMCWSVAVRRVPPHFSIPPENAEVLPGGAVNLTCVAIGSPMPFVRWRLGAVDLTPEDNPPIGKNILQLRDIRETATYTCVATSDLGNIEYDAEVRVKGTAVLGTNRSMLSSDVLIVLLFSNYALNLARKCTQTYRKVQVRTQLEKLKKI